MPDRSALSFNMAEPNDFQPNQPYLNWCKVARPWFYSFSGSGYLGPGASKDSDGYVTNLGSNGRAETTAGAVAA